MPAENDYLEESDSEKPLRKPYPKKNIKTMIEKILLPSKNSVISGR